MKYLKEKYATLNTEKKVLGSEYQELRHSEKDIDNAWQNVKAILNIEDNVSVEDVVSDVNVDIKTDLPSDKIPDETKTNWKNEPDL